MADLINNRYRVIRELGQGGMGAVYLVEDTLQDDQAMTLKMIRPDLLDERNLAQFQHEFAALVSLNHPNLVTVHSFDMLADGRGYFYTMEYVAGENLRDHADHLQPPASSFQWLYEIAVQVCRALQYIHSRGLVHYDVKPTNILVTPEGQVKLADFGLIGEARGEGQMRIRGTPEYIAPEVVRGGAVDHRADLYSLGVSLYEIVAGRPPFTGESSVAIMRQHVEATAEPPRQFNANVPEALQTIILTLMARDPAERYASADEVIQAINRLTGLDFPVETRETKRGYIQSGSLVGREFELARLQGLLMRAIQGHGRLVLITGPMGVGKSRLVRELRLRAQMQRVLVCESVCPEHVRVPYRPWVSIFRQIIAYQRSTRPEVVQVYGPALVRLMPELAEHIGPLSAVGEVAEDVPGLMDAAARFLMSCERPLMFVLGDLHFADAETVSLLEHLGRRAAQARWLLCGVYREPGGDEAHPLDTLMQRARPLSHRPETQTPPGEQPYDLLRLNTLNENEAADLLKSMLGVKELPPNLLPRLMAETGGNPLFIESIMHSLVEENLLRYDGQGWQIDFARLTHIPSSIHEVAQRRLERLDAEALGMLQWAALLGQWLELDVLTAVSGLAQELVLRLLNEAVQRHVLAVSEPAGQPAYRFSTDAMRQAVLQTLTAEERAQRHRRIGETIRAQRDETEAAEWLAWHFEQAGDSALALRYWKLAGDRARQVYANESAIQHYSHALALIEEQHGLTDSETEYDILSGRETCHALVGDRRAQQADLERMEQIARQSGNVRRQIEVATRRATLANLLGHHAEACQAAQATLELARQAGNRQWEAQSLSALGDAHRSLSEHELAHACYQQALDLYRELDDRRGEASSLLQLGHLARRSGRSAEAQSFFEQSLAIFRTLGLRQGEADALNALGNLVNDYAQKRHYHERSLAIAQAIGHRANQARSYNNLAIIYWSLGLYGRARDYLEQAVQIQREMQGRASLAYYLETLGRVYLELGEYPQAQQVLEEGRALCMETGDRWAESTYWQCLGRLALARGQAAQARERLQIACQMQREMGSLGFLASSLAWLGAADLALGDEEAARQHTEEAVACLEQAGNAGDYPSQEVWWMRYQALKTTPGRAETDTLDDAAWTCLQRAHDVMMAAIATLSDEGLRRNYLNKVRINHDIVTEWTRQAASRAGDAELLPTAETGGAAEPPPADDRLQRVLDISVQMNETHEVEQLLNFVMDQVIELSGAERGFLVLLDPTGQMDFKVTRGIERAEIERASSDISYTVIGTVTQTRMPVLLQDALADERFGRQSSVLELNLRSVLCVPLVSRSELIGMIYADNRSVSGRFSQADLDLMSIFANQAAIAIENARLYEETVRAKEELEVWAHTLEQRVAGRTAELRQANEALSRRALQLETSSQVGQQVTSILDLDELLQRVVNLIQNRFRYYFVGVWLADEGRGFVTLRAGARQGGGKTGREELHIPLDAPGVIAEVCRSGQPRTVAEVCPTSESLPLEALPGQCAELALPLRIGHKTIGALDILIEEPTTMDADERMVLQTLADQITIAIRNAQLYAAERNRRRLAESLEQTGRALSSSLHLSEVPARILEQLMAVVPYERGSVLLRRGQMLELVAQRGFPEDERAKTLQVAIRDTEEDVFQRMVRGLTPLLVADVTQEPGWQQVEWLPVNRSWIGVPLVVKGAVIGMISLTRAEASAFSPDDVQSVQAFAGQAAIALENARLYDEITRFNEQLEQMVQQRTEELHKAYRTLEQLDQTKTDFIDVAAHELRTPLTLVKGYTQVLESYPTIQKDPEVRTLLNGIMTGATRLYEIVNSMLDAAKIDSEVLWVHREPLWLADTVRYVVSEFETALRERHLTLTTRGLERLPIIQGDPGLLYKVFYHLIGNAIKYTPDGGAITVSGREDVELDGAPAVEVVVSDTGIGIDPEHHELIFEKFYQTGKVDLHSSGRIKFKGGGPGLGLAIARGIVLAHQGRIWVESEGHDDARCPGSHFHVRLPIR